MQIHVFVSLSEETEQFIKTYRYSYTLSQHKLATEHCVWDVAAKNSNLF